MIFLTGAKISPVEFWSEHTYTDEKEERKYCYRFLTERQMSPSELKSLFYLLNEGAYEMLTEGIKAAQSPKKKGLEDKKTNIQMASRKGQKGRTIDNPIKISITIGNKVITEMQ
ncbi:hypothetical protein FMM75_05605 [Lachnospiraceae bacterium MD335]|nr:hypothetical protein [Lachnospiraceae bacterium MD335]